MIDCVVRGELLLERRALSRGELVSLEEGLSYDNPAHLAARSRGAATDYIPARLTALRLVDGTVRIPRAAYRLVRRVLGERVRFVDETSRGRRIAVNLRREMRQHQLQAAYALLGARQGIANATTGAGKTGLACVAIAWCRAETLWIAPTLDLARQAQSEIRSFLGIEAAMMIDGRLELGPVVVGTWDTVHKHLDAIESLFGLAVYDECHGSLSERRLDVVRGIRARYRLGLTATLKREDPRAPLLAWHFGRVIARYGVTDGVEGGVLARPRLRELRTEFRFDYDGADDWAELQDALFDDVDRQLLVAQDVARDAGGRLALVLSTRKDHLRDLQALLRGLGVRAEVLTGELPKRQREAVLEQARAGQLEALLCTQLADEGLDLPTADRLYLTAPSKSPSRLLQRIGRIVRVAAGKRQPEIIDVVDGHVGVLAHQARQRRRTFEDTWGEASRSAA